MASRNDHYSFLYFCGNFALLDPGVRIRIHNTAENIDELLCVQNYSYNRLFILFEGGDFRPSLFIR
jgi:hypothetical protein